MSARTKARKRALDMLFQADVREEPLAIIVAAESKRAAGEPDRVASWLYAREIVDGVNDHREEMLANFQVANGTKITSMSTTATTTLSTGLCIVRVSGTGSAPRLPN